MFALRFAEVSSRHADRLIFFYVTTGRLRRREPRLACLWEKGTTGKGRTPGRRKHGKSRRSGRGPCGGEPSPPGMLDRSLGRTRGLTSLHTMLDGSNHRR